MGDADPRSFLHHNTAPEQFPHRTVAIIRPRDDSQRRRGSFEIKAFLEAEAKHDTLAHLDFPIEWLDHVMGFSREGPNASAYRRNIGVRQRLVSVAHCTRIGWHCPDSPAPKPQIRKAVPVTEVVL